MGVIYILLSISLGVALVFFVAFVISVRSGQYDDSYTPSVRMLFEDEILPQLSDPELKKSPTKKETQSKSTD